MHTNNTYKSDQKNNYFGTQIENLDQAQPYADFASNLAFGYDEQQGNEYQEGNEELLENADFVNDNDVEWFELGTIETSAVSGQPNAVTSIAYDNYEELLWVGHQNGLLESFYGPGSSPYGLSIADRYTSVFSQTSDVLAILSHQNGVATVGHDRFKFHDRGGVVRISYSNDNMRGLSCMMYSNTDSEDIVFISGSSASHIFIFDVRSARVLKEIPASYGGAVAMKRSQNSICVGHTTGIVTLRDPHTFHITQSLQPHSGGITDLAAFDNYLVTCGWSKRVENIFLDNYLNVYDLRMNKAVPMPPIPFPAGPYLAQFYPSYLNGSMYGSQYSESGVASDKLVIVSQTGQFQLWDMMDTLNSMTEPQPEKPMKLYQISVGDNLQCFDISSTGNLIAFGDLRGNVTQWSFQLPHQTLYSSPLPSPSVSLRSSSASLTQLPGSTPTTPQYEPIPSPVLRSQSPGGPPGSPLKRSGSGLALTQSSDSLLDGFSTLNFNLLKINENSNPTETVDYNPYIPASKPKMHENVPLSSITLTQETYQELHNPTVPTHINGSLSFVNANPNTFKSPSYNLVNHILLSDWNINQQFHVPPPPKRIETSLFPDFRQVDFVGYATNPVKRGGKHMYSHHRSHHASHHKDSSSSTSGPARKLDIILQPAKPKKQRPPSAYRHVEIKHTKLGLDVFDFKSYNQTCFAGLENILSTSYCNSVLQTLYFVPPLRISMLNHLCRREFCLSCELGFLFYMLDRTAGSNCEASNFLRSFRQIPQASGLGLTETPADDEVALIRLMETFNRFILEQLQKESIELITGQTKKYQQKLKDKEKDQSSNQSIIDQIFGSTSIAHSKCMSCKFEMTRESRSFQYDMAYTDASKSATATFIGGIASIPTSSGNKTYETFSTALTASLRRLSHTKAWCDKCQRYQLTEQRRQLASLPNVLSLNTAASKADMDFWKSKYEASEKNSQGPVSSWLPLKMRVRIDSKGELLVEENSFDSSDYKPSDTDAIYHLMGIISHLYDPSKKASRHSHLVTQIKVDPSYFELHGIPADEERWYLFNDFHVTPCSVREVVDFSFKSPCVLFFVRQDIDSRIPPVPIQNPISEESFFQDTPIKNRNLLSFIPVTRATLPQAGELVAIDAEFVSLGAEETEIRSDGTTAVINPCHFSLARVSVLKGSTGEVFIDDYIVTNEPVVDYLTRFSGIVPGDLDPKVSKHHVTTLKAVYTKLRCLADRGCVFLGHGLSKDFRIVNMVLPPEQVIDTVELFHLEGQRKISLRFLASCLLNEDIQAETHDSIEDARTTLKVYNKYLQLRKENRFEQLLLMIYDVGRQTKWTVTGKEHALLENLLNPQQQ